MYLGKIRRLILLFFLIQSSAFINASNLSDNERKALQEISQSILLSFSVKKAQIIKQNKPQKENIEKLKIMLDTKLRELNQGLLKIEKSPSDNLTAYASPIMRKEQLFIDPKTQAVTKKIVAIETSLPAKKEQHYLQARSSRQSTNDTKTIAFFDIEKLCQQIKGQANQHILPVSKNTGMIARSKNWFKKQLGLSSVQQPSSQGTQKPEIMIANNVEMLLKRIKNNDKQAIKELEKLKNSLVFKPAVHNVKTWSDPSITTLTKHSSSN